MARMTQVGTVAAALLSAAAMALAQPARGDAPGDGASAVAFIARIYQGYGAGKHRALDYDGADAGRVFDPSIVALMRRSHEAHADEALDWLSDHDIFCRCQDFTELRTRTRLERLSGGRALVAASFTDRGTRQAPQTLRFDLIRRGGSWRIRDVLDPETGSLRAALLDDARRFPVRPPPVHPIEPRAAAPRPKTRGR